MLGNATCEQSCSLTFSFSDIRIIGKGRRIQMKKIAHLLLGRFSIVAVSIILQFLWLVSVQLSVHICKSCDQDNRNYCGAGDRKPLDESGK
mgnify:CR=1 FL=1